jgi:hypothetical protein
MAGNHSRSPIDGVDAAAARALLRAVRSECEGTSGTKAQRIPLPECVAGYFWPDADHPEIGAGGRSPLGVVVDRVREQVHHSKGHGPSGR